MRAALGNGRSPRASAGMAAAIVLLALNLRTLFASLPPLLAEVRADLGLSASAASLLTTGPVLCFAAMAPAAPMLTRRVSIERVVLWCGLLSAAGIALRAAGGVAGLYAGTLLAGAAIAFVQTVLPAYVRGRYPRQLGPLTGAFSMSLTLGSAIAAGLAVPLERLLGGWRASLAAWAVPAAVAALAWLPAASGEGTTTRGLGGPPVVRRPLAWSVAGLFGMQSAAFFGGLTWLPSILRADGYSAATAGTLQAVSNLIQFAPAFLLPVLASRMRGQGLLLTAVVAVPLVGLVGLLLAPGGAPGWMMLVGLGQGAVLGLGLIMPVLRGGDVRSVAALTAMMLSVGYLISAVGPWLLGVARDASGGWTAPLLCLIALTALELPVGLAATRHGTIAAPPPEPTT